ESTPTPSAPQRQAASRSQMLSPTTAQWVIGTLSRAAAAKNRSGSGFARATSSRVITGIGPSRPRISIVRWALSRLPLVAIAQGTEREVDKALGGHPALQHLGEAQRKLATRGFVASPGPSGPGHLQEVAQPTVGGAQAARENAADVLEDDHVAVVVLVNQPIEVEVGERVQGRRFGDPNRGRPGL